MNLSAPNLSLSRPLAALDVEATGVDPAASRAVEVAVVKLLPDGRCDEFHARLDPGVPIPPAAAVHGIADADVAGCPRFGDVAGDLHRFLAGADLAGFGVARFDLPLLAAEFARAGIAFRVAGRAILDAVTVYHRMEPRTLSAAVRLYLGRDHEGAHSARADARAALAVLDAQVERYGLPPAPAALHARFVEVDVGGRFRRGPDGRVAFAFGKHAGTPLAAVARADPGYLEWMLGLAFLDDVRALVRTALAG